MDELTPEEKREEKIQMEEDVKEEKRLRKSRRRPPKGKPGHRKDFAKRKALVIWITPQLRKKLGAAAKAKKLSIAALARQCFERLAK
jgi:hypothetical protein